MRIARCPSVHEGQRCKLAIDHTVADHESIAGWTWPLPPPTPDDIHAAITIAPPGSVVIIRGDFSDEERAVFNKIMATWEPPDDHNEQLIIFLPADDRPVEVLDEDAMASAGWFRGDPAGDEDDPRP